MYNGTVPMVKDGTRYISEELGNINMTQQTDRVGGRERETDGKQRVREREREKERKRERKKEREIESAKGREADVLLHY